MFMVWTYIKLDCKGNATASCYVCKLGFLPSGKARAAFNSTNLIRNPKNKHPTKYS